MVRFKTCKNNVLKKEKRVKNRENELFIKLFKLFIIKGNNKDAIKVPVESVLVP